MLSGKLLPVVHRVVLMDRGEESELRERGTMRRESERVRERVGERERERETHVYFAGY